MNIITFISNNKLHTSTKMSMTRTLILLAALTLAGAVVAEAAECGNEAGGMLCPSIVPPPPATKPLSLLPPPPSTPTPGCCQPHRPPKTASPGLPLSFFPDRGHVPFSLVALLCLPPASRLAPPARRSPTPPSRHHNPVKRAVVAPSYAATALRQACRRQPVFKGLWPCQACRCRPRPTRCPNTAEPPVLRRFVRKKIGWVQEDDMWGPWVGTWRLETRRCFAIQLTTVD
ncbi:hypothetical protein PVAP13_7KG034309 [Panicum virgatum]|uniref:Uncharacterized protein n=1 Tax=Panicum virgatum TaxID=38727 RepID=A0A8T0QAA2_PANVG|nr:hypothetical protein PVAP13_7KG034309 [Panicum virgatum]